MSNRITVNAMGDTCPIPLIKTKKAMAELKEDTEVFVLVDNEIAVQNLNKLAKSMGFSAISSKISEGKLSVMIGFKYDENIKLDNENDFDVEDCTMDKRGNKVVVINSSTMGEGSEELGKILIKGFIYAISQQETLPKTMLFYNGGAKLTCEGSDSIDDLKTLEAEGVEILTCGTCLNYYGLSEKLQVGGVTNMYVIAEKMSDASLLIKP